jgi:CheY-like chemotaxis protein
VFWFRQRRSRVRGGVPVICNTAAADQLDTALLEAAGFDGLLRKPFTPQQLEVVFRAVSVR